MKIIQRLHSRTQAPAIWPAATLLLSCLVMGLGCGGGTSGGKDGAGPGVDGSEASGNLDMAHPPGSIPPVGDAAAAHADAAAYLDSAPSIFDATPRPDLGSSPLVDGPGSSPDTAAGVGIACGSCGGVTGADGTCSKPTPGDYGRSCGSCGGTIQCDGSCSNPMSSGQACGMCGGTTQCDGTCSMPTPPRYGEPCGQCGGTIKCDGGCSVPTPGDYGQSCGQCGGTVKCDGSCTMQTPSGYGQSCGSCGGTTQCDGSCSVPTPGNYGQSCGQCGGTYRCDGSCSTQICGIKPGTWSGITSQGKTFELVVDASGTKITNFKYGFTGCGTADVETNGNIAINNNSFSANFGGICPSIRINGTFSGSTVTGSLSLSWTPIPNVCPCSGSAAPTFTASAP
jgi:hypothetical protein